MSNPARSVIIDYTNWRGERKLRVILPITLIFESNEWHPLEQWLLQAVDLDTGQIRTFAFTGIHSWKLLSDL